ncbi:MAG: PAS domain-containing sensor histidine kinase [Candidatus Kapabacteria bacterium]|nr:PAS domain-containing sensor histidine kinase [Candidatus Kapabacteria bacterium]
MNDFTFKYIFESLSAIMLLIDPETSQINDANNAASDFYGYSRAELQSMLISELNTLPSDQISDIQQRILQGTENHFIFNHRLANGEERTVEVQSSPIELEGKHLLFSIIHDITDRINTELTLLKSESLYKSILNASPDAIVLTDLEGSIKMISSATYKLFHYQNEDNILNRNVLEFVHPNDRDRAKINIIKMFQGYELGSEEYRVTRKDGSYFHAEINRDMIRNEKGQATGIVYIIRDISERKLLYLEREQFYKFFITSGDIMVIANPLGAFNKINPACSELLGYSENEMISKPFVDFIIPEDKQATIDEMALQMQKGYSLNFENRYLCKDGTIKWLSWRAIYVKDEGVTYATARDITDQKKVEKSLRESEEKYRAFFTAASEGIIVTNFITKNIAFANPSACKLFGYSHDEFIGLNMADLHPKDDLSQILLEFEAAAHNEKSLSTNISCINKKGTIFYCNINGFPLEFDSTVYNVGFFTDISEQRLFIEEINKKSEELDSYFNNALDLFCISNTDGLFLKLNIQWENVLGYKIEELVGTNFLNLVHPDDIKSTLDAISTLSDQNPILNFKNRYKTKDGSYRILEWRSKPSGNLIYAAARDITERIATEEALRESEEFTKSIIENEPECVKILGPGGILKYMNPAGLKMIEIDSLTEVEGQCIYQMVAPEQRAAFIKLTEDVFRGESAKLVFEMQGAKGTFRWLDTHAVPLFDSTGKVESLLGITRDITDQKLAEDALRANNSKISAILDAIPDLMFILDKDGIFLDYHSPDNSILYSDPQVFIGKNISDVLPQEISLNINKIFNSAIQSKQIQLFEYTLPLAGTDHYFETRIFAFEQDKILCMVSDITKRKLSELELKATITERDKFFSIIAHDLKAPFNGFLGLTRIMSEDIQDMTLSEMQRISTNMQESASNLYALLENLLEWSRMQRGVTQFNPEICNLSLLVNNIIDVNNLFAKQKMIKLQNHVPSNFKIKADIPMINTILRNLISNAIKFTPTAGNIEIGVSKSATDQEKSHDIIFIKDNGIGMNQFIIENLFQLDQKVSRPGTEGEPSTGLGLILCKEFVEKHSGKIWVESQEGQGSTFYFSL